MSKLKYYIILFVLIFISKNVMGYQINNTTFSELFDKSVSVSRVKINSANLVVNKTVNGIYNCGYNYSAKVISKYKGGNTSLSFRSNSQLLVGNEYIIFTNREYLGAKLKYLSMGNNNRQAYISCSTGSVTLFANEVYGEIMEFDSLRKIVTGDEALKTNTANYLLLKSLKAKKVKYENSSSDNIYLNISYWLISWKEFEKKLRIKGESKGSDSIDLEK